MWWASHRTSPASSARCSSTTTRSCAKGPPCCGSTASASSWPCNWSDAAVAGQKASLEQAQRDYARYRQLGKDVVAQQKIEQTQAAQDVAAAAYQQALANQGVARLNLERSEIRAPVNGVITNMVLNPGDYVSAGKAVMALVDSDSLHVEGYFEETKLARIRLGDTVDIHLMGQTALLTGHVESIAGGIVDRERSSGSNLLADVNPTFSWVRLAQRVPIRIALDHVPESVQLVAGLTATVVVARGSSGESQKLSMKTTMR
jgi:multidrug resistance efflux pump